MNSCQCFGPVSRPAASSLLYRGVAGSGVIKPKIGSPGGQERISLRVRSATPGVSLSMPKITEVMAKTLRRASRSSTTAYSPGLLKPFFTSARLAGSMDSIPMKIHLPPAAAIRSTSSSSRSRLALIWATQCTCALAAMMSRSNDFVRFTLMAKLSSMKNTAIWPPSSRARAFSSSSSFTTLSFVRKRMESPKNPVTVQNSHPYGQPRPDSTGIIRNVPHPPPTRFRSGCKNPGSTLSSAHRVRHAISLGDHPGHCTDAHQPDILFTHVARDTFFIHGLRVAVNQHHFVARWSQCLQQKHPKMRHEVARYTVIWVVQ